MINRVYCQFQKTYHLVCRQVWATRAHKTLYANETISKSRLIGNDTSKIQ